MDYDPYKKPPPLRMLAKDPEGRRMLFSLCAFIGTVAGSSLYFMLTAQGNPPPLAERIFAAFFKELCVAALLFSLCGMVWAIAMPGWVELLFEVTSRHLRFATAMFVIAFLVFTFIVLEI